MESLIPLIIMLIVGSLFGGKKNKKEDGQEQAKPFTPQKEQQEGPVKKLKEMSRDMYKEIQRELEKESDKQRPDPQTIQRTLQQSEVKVTPERVEVSIPLREKRVEPIRSSRSSRRDAKQVTTNQQKVAGGSLMPKTPDDIMKGVIFSEIFGPPKSKR